VGGVVAWERWSRAALGRGSGARGGGRGRRWRSGRRLGAAAIVASGGGGGGGGGWRGRWGGEAAGGGRAAVGAGEAAGVAGGSGWGAADGRRFETKRQREMSPRELSAALINQ
jgi:translation initiation factor IF-2